MGTDAINEANMIQTSASEKACSSTERVEGTAPNEDAAKKADESNMLQHLNEALNQMPPASAVARALGVLRLMLVNQGRVVIDEEALKALLIVYAMEGLERPLDGNPLALEDVPPRAHQGHYWVQRWWRHLEGNASPEAQEGATLEASCKRRRQIRTMKGSASRSWGLLGGAVLFRLSPGIIPQSNPAFRLPTLAIGEERVQKKGVPSSLAVEFFFHQPEGPGQLEQARATFKPSKQFWGRELKHREPIYAVIRKSEEERDRRACSPPLTMLDYPGPTQLSSRESLFDARLLRQCFQQNI